MKQEEPEKEISTMAIFIGTILALGFILFFVYLIISYYKEKKTMKTELEEV